MNDDTESGIQYDDQPYVSYEYPSAYRRTIGPGEPFIYYRGRRRRTGGRQPQVYIGTGIIGDIRESRRPGRLVCEILDGVPFETPLYFKADDGTPLEPEGVRKGYYQRGVRRIPESVFNDILTRANSASPRTGNSETATPRPGHDRGSSLYARDGVGRMLEDYSRRVAIEYLQTKMPGCRVTPMPLNNPGYDLHVSGGDVTYVEVKATQAPFPRFLISEGERRFAQAHADAYLLLVVYGISLRHANHAAIEVCRGDPTPQAQLEPTQWAGRLPMATATAAPASAGAA